MKDIYKLGVSSFGLALAFFVLINVGFEKLGLYSVVATLGVVLVSVSFLNYLWIKEKNLNVFFTVVAFVTGVLLYLLLNQQGLLGIDNVQKMVDVPTPVAGILDFVVVDVLGIPSWAIVVAFIALIAFILINPLLGVGMFLIMLGIALFFITPGFFGDDLVSAGLGVIMSVAGVTRGFKKSISTQPQIIVVGGQ